MKAYAKDMTHGSEAGLMIRFALPLLLGNLLQQLYNIADTIIVGKYLGDDALAAVGATGSITYLFYTCCVGLAAGAGIIIAQFFGAGQMAKLRSAVWNSALITAVFGIGITAVSVLLTVPALRLLQVPEDLLPTAAAYMRVACGGTVAVAAYNWINALMRALGDSRTPLIFLGIASGLNVALDLLFVTVFGWGVSGAAAATVLSQLCSAFGCTVFAFRKMPELSLSPEERTLDGAMLRLCIRTGIPIALQSALISVSMVILQSVANYFEGVVMTAYTASLRIEQFIQQPFISLNAAVSTFTGQNIGAGEEERSRRGLRIGLCISTMFALAVAAVFWLFAEPLISCMISGEESVAIGVFALRVTSLFYIPLGMIYITRGFLNGAGDTAYALINGLSEVICRVGCSMVLVYLCGYDYRAIWYTTCVTWLVTGIVGLVRYRSDKWRSKSIGTVLPPRTEISLDPHTDLRREGVQRYT